MVLIFQFRFYLVRLSSCSNHFLTNSASLRGYDLIIHIVSCFNSGLWQVSFHLKQAFLKKEGHAHLFRNKFFNIQSPSAHYGTVLYVMFYAYITYSRVKQDA